MIFEDMKNTAMKEAFLATCAPIKLYQGGDATCIAWSHLSAFPAETWCLMLSRSPIKSLYSDRNPDTEGFQS